MSTSTSELNALLSYLTPQERDEAISLLQEISTEVELSHDLWPDIVEWAEGNFFLADTGERIVIPEIVAKALREALKRDENGRYVYSTVVWSWPKKSMKSTTIALVADYVATFKPRARIKLIGNDLKQADSRVGEYLRESLLIGQKEGTRDQAIKISYSKYRINYPNRSYIEMLPIDAHGEAGGNDDLIVCSELWGWMSNAHQRMWTETTQSPTKMGYSQRWVDTYAGFEGESTILEGLYDATVKEENLLVAQVDTATEKGRQEQRALQEYWDDFEIYAKGGVLTIWCTRPLFYWQTPEYYADQRVTLTAPEYRRIHRNQWTTSENIFVNYHWWENCRDAALPAVDPDEELVVAIDAATDEDAFAIVAVARDPRNPTKDGALVLRYWDVWYPKQLKNEGEGGKFTYEEPKAMLRWLANHRNVVQFAYDPYQMKDTADELEKEGLGWFAPFGQQVERSIADKMFHDIIRAGTFKHQADHRLDSHIKNANAKTESRSRMRIVKRKDHLKIDLAVAASMACKRARDVLVLDNFGQETEPELIENSLPADESFSWWEQRMSGHDDEIL